MAQRRQRVLDEAARLLEHGLDGFTIRELSRRAQVSITTLYSAFGGKEAIVAIAIEARHKAILEKIPKRADPETPIAHLLHYDAIADAIAAMPKYAAAMAAVFFSPRADNAAYKVLSKISRDRSGAWLRRAESRGVIRPLSPQAKERLLSLTSNASYATVLDWAAGRLDPGELRNRLKLNFLTCVYFAIEPAHREAVGAVIDALRSNRRAGPTA